MQVYQIFLLIGAAVAEEVGGLVIGRCYQF